MALQIIGPVDPIPVKNLKVTLYGDTNIGKSSLALSFPSPFLIDFDGGAQRAIRSGSDRIARVENWDDVEELVQVTKMFEGSQTIIIDTVSTCLDMLAIDIMRRDTKMGYGGALNQKGWGILGNRFKMFLLRLVESGKDVVMIAQSREKDNVDQSTQMRIKAQGAAQGIIQEASDFMGYLHSKNNARTISFTWCDNFYAKDVRDTMGSFVLDDPATKPGQGARMIEKMRTAFVMAAEAQAQIVQTVQEWRDTIGGFTTPDEFNAVMGEFKALTNPAVKAQVGALIKARRDELGISYTAERGFYIEPKAADAQPSPAPTTAPAPTPAPAPAEAMRPAVSPTPVAPATNGTTTAGLEF